MHAAQLQLLLDDYQSAKSSVALLSKALLHLQARAPRPAAWCSHPDQSRVLEAAREALDMRVLWRQRGASLITALARQHLFFPDRRLIQFDCGKLQV